MPADILIDNAAREGFIADLMRDVNLSRIEADRTYELFMSRLGDTIAAAAVARAAQRPIPTSGA